MYATPTTTTPPTTQAPESNVPATRWRIDVRGLIRLLRPEQWAKNILIVSVPLLDTRGPTVAGLGRVALAIVAFTVASGIVYIVNDIVDRGRDRMHPEKRLRPIASGRVPVRAASVLAAVLVALLAGIIGVHGPIASWPVLAYLALSAAYTGKLKHLPIIDAFAVASGFVLRLLQGYLALGQEISGWLVTVVLALCLLLTLGKRRHELRVSDALHRPALRGYSLELTGQLMTFSAVLSMGSYLLYLRTEAPLGPYATAAAVASAPFALFGIFRYLQLVTVRDGGGSPVSLLMRDPAILIDAGLWGALSVGFLIAAAQTGGAA